MGKYARKLSNTKFARTRPSAWIIEIARLPAGAVWKCSLRRHRLNVGSCWKDVTRDQGSRWIWPVAASAWDSSDTPAGQQILPRISGRSPRVKIPLKNEQSAYWSKRRGCKTGAALPAAHGPNRTSKIIHLHGYYESPDTVVLASATISVFWAIQEASLSGPTPRHLHGVTNAGTPYTSRHQPMYFDFLSKIKSG